MPDHRSFVRALAHLGLAVVLGSSWACKSDDKNGQEGADTPESEASAEDGKPGKQAQSDLPAAEGLLAKALEAAGGKQRFDQIESFYQEGKVEIAGQNIEGDVKVWWKDGDFYTESNMVGVGLVRAGKRGDVIWSQDPITGLRQLEGREAEQATWSSSLSLVGDWKEHFEQAKTTGEREIDGKKVYDVTLTSKSGDEVVLTFDAETGLQVAQSFKRANPMGDMPIDIRFEDYRDIDGVKISFRQVTDTSLAEVTQTISEVKLDVPIDETKFAMPRGGKEVVRVGGEDENGKSGRKNTAMPFGPDGKPGRPVPEDGN